MSMDIGKIRMPDVDTMVMLSGGVESSVLLQLVRKRVTKRVAAIFSAFGQAASERQRSYASRLCNQLGVPFLVIEGSNIFHVDIGASDPPHTRQEERNGSQGTEATTVFIASRLGYALVYSGLTASDALRLPGVDYTKTGQALNDLLAGANSQTRYSRPFFENNATDDDVLSYAVKEKLEYTETWSCVWGERFHCGVCYGCTKRKSVFADLGMNDPTRYLKGWPDDFAV